MTVGWVNAASPRVVLPKRSNHPLLRPFSLAVATHHTQPVTAAAKTQSLAVAPPGLPVVALSRSILPQPVAPLQQGGAAAASLAAPAVLRRGTGLQQRWSPSCRGALAVADEGCFAVAAAGKVISPRRRPFAATDERRRVVLLQEKSPVHDAAAAITMDAARRLCVAL